MELVIFLALREYCLWTHYYLQTKISQRPATVKGGQRYLRAKYSGNPASIPPAEQKDRLFAEQVPEPPRCVEPQRRPPGIERHRLFHPDSDFGAELAKVLDGAMMDIRRVVPAERQDIGARHMAREQELQPDLPVAEIRERHDRVAPDPQHVFQHDARVPRGLQGLREDDIVEGIVGIVAK